MNIEIKKSLKPVNYNKAIKFLEKRLLGIHQNKSNELLWILNHPSIYTGGTNYKKNEILDNSIKVIDSSRGGKLTWHGSGLSMLFCFRFKKKK